MEIYYIAILLYTGWAITWQASLTVIFSQCTRLH